MKKSEFYPSSLSTLKDEKKKCIKVQKGNLKNLLRHALDKKIIHAFNKKWKFF